MSAVVHICKIQQFSKGAGIQTMVLADTVFIFKIVDT